MPIAGRADAAASQPARDLANMSECPVGAPSVDELRSIGAVGLLRLPVIHACDLGMFIRSNGFKFRQEFRHGFGYSIVRKFEQAERAKQRIDDHVDGALCIPQSASEICQIPWRVGLRI